MFRRRGANQTELRHATLRASRSGGVLRQPDALRSTGMKAADILHRDICPLGSDTLL
jgi:hypothetical protein